MLLAIDVGNTNIVVGVFDAEHLIADFRLRTEDRLTGDELGLMLVELLQRRDIASTSIDSVIISNVVPALARTLGDVARTYFECAPMFVGPGIRTGMRIRVEDPREVGADRIANAVAAHSRYGGPLTIVDFGTATTFDAVDESGDFLGGAIAPGIQISHDALVSRAARLGGVELTAPQHAIGRNTMTNMQSGLVFGYVGLVEGLVRRFTDELGGTAKVIATGGLAAELAPLMEVIDVVDERLTLDGLRLIHHHNI
jgi:type III pantothenate kinase